MKSVALLFALLPLTASADTPQQPACNTADFFSTQFEYTQGRVVEPGQVLLLGEEIGCLDEEHAGCRSGDAVEPGSGLIIGDRWNGHYCVQVLPPGEQVVGWAPAQRVMKTANYAENSPTDWVAHWEGGTGRALDIVARGAAFELSMPGGGTNAAPTVIGSAVPDEISGNLHLSQGACETRVSLQGTTYLVVSDNGQCGAVMGGLRGVYENRARVERLMRLLER